MQKNWDDFDKIIVDSKPEIEPQQNYNRLLLSKINDENVSKPRNYIPAVSLITAGFLLIFLQMGEVQSQVSKVEYQVKTGITLLENDLWSSNFVVERDLSGKKK